jgi:FHA domain/Domain of unknown function (DUF1707)
MGGSAAETPTHPDAPPGVPAGAVRASDAERDEVVGKLKEEFAAGRLSQDTFMYRMNAVLEARHQADLPPLLADLPAVRPQPRRPQPGPAQPGPPQPGPPQPGPGQPGPGQPGPGQPGLAARMRAAWAPVRQLTGRLARVGAIPVPPERRVRPAPLEFPRGAGVFFSIGRASSCDLTIADLTVSRVHARLERTAEGWLLTDLSSTNGTRVNGWRVRGQVRVRAGDLVSFGSAEYSLGAADGG